MTYKTGSLGTTSTPAKDIVDMMSADMVLAGWVLVENDYAEGIYTWDVLRSPSTLNSVGNEFFVAIGHTTTGGSTMVWTAMKEWNSTTKRATRFLPNTTSLTPDSLGYNPQGNVALPSTGTQMYNRTVTLATAETYWYSVTIDRIILMTAPSAATQARMFWYMGLFDSILPLSLDPMPFVFTGSFASSGPRIDHPVSSSAGQGAAMTEPAVTVAQAQNFSCGGVAFSQGYNSYPNGDSYFANINQYTGQRPIHRVAITGRGSVGNTSTPPNGFDFLRGFAKDVYASYAGNVVGDVVEWAWGSTTYTAVAAVNSSSTFKPLMGRV